MSITLANRPTLERAALLTCVVAAMATLACTFIINPHSFPWLIGVYATVVLFIAALRSAKKSTLHRSYAVYLAALNQYLLVVWLLHAMTPGQNPDQTEERISILMRLLSMGCIYMAVCLYHFTLRFVNAKSLVLVIIEIIGFLGSTYYYVLLLKGTLFSDYAWTGYTWVPAMDDTYRGFFYFTTFYVMMGTGYPMCCLVFTHDRLKKLQLFYYLLGGIPLWLSCWAHFLLSLGINVYPAGGLFFLLHVGVMAYAVFRKKLFDFTIVMRRGLAYAVVSLFVGTAYGIVVLLMEKVTLSTTGTGILSGIILVCVTGLVYMPLLALVQSKVDRLFFRSFTDKRLQLEKFTYQVSQTIDLAELTRHLLDVCNNTFNPWFLRLYLAQGTQRPKLYCTLSESYETKGWPNSEELPKIITDVTQTSKVLLDDRNVGTRVLQAEGEAWLSIPILHSKQLLGCLLISPKRSDLPYNEDDIRFLETISAQSSVGLLNARSYAQLESLQKFTTQTIEALTAGVLIVDAKGTFVKANREVRRILGWDSGESYTLGELSSEYVSLQHAIVRSLKEGIYWENEEVEVKLDKRMCILLSTAPITTVDGDIYCLIVINDITRYKMIEDNARQRENLARLGEAIAKVNHEVRNVIQPIQYEMHNLSAVASNDKAVNSAIKIIPERLHALDRLLSTLRNLARPIHLNIASLELGDLVMSVWHDLRSLHQDRLQIVLEFPSETKVAADGQWLRLALYNLIRNAIEATQDRNNPLIRIVHTQVKDDVILMLSDNGCGMDEAALERAFTLFFSTKGEAGTGLGLSFARKIVELHGGEITVSSVADIGTTFRIVLPARTIKLQREHHQAALEIRE
jgi:two-component system, NtrC family, nitrogen regulation sensor histidine kinase NtrY